MDGIGFRAERVVAPSGRVGCTVVDAVGIAVAPAEARVGRRWLFLRERIAAAIAPLDDPTAWHPQHDANRP